MPHTTIGLLVAAIGAVLLFALEPPDARVVDVPTLGLVLLLVGALEYAVGVGLEVTRRRAAAAPAPGRTPPADRRPVGGPAAPVEPRVAVRPAWVDGAPRPAPPGAPPGAGPGAVTRPDPTVRAPRPPYADPRREPATDPDATRVLRPGDDPRS